jgi:hypothetical protein
MVALLSDRKHPARKLELRALSFANFVLLALFLLGQLLDPVTWDMLKTLLLREVFLGS